MRRRDAALTQHDPADRQGDLEAVAAALASLADAGRGVLPTARPLDPPAVEPIEDAPRDAGTAGSPGQDTHTLHAVLDAVDDPAPLGGSGIGVEPAPAEADRPADAGAPAAEPPTLQLGAGRDRDPPVARLAVVGALFAAAVGVTWWSTLEPAPAEAQPRLVQINLMGAHPPGDVGVWVDGKRVNPKRGVRITAAEHRFEVGAGAGTAASSWSASGSVLRDITWTTASRSAISGGMGKATRPVRHSHSKTPRP